MAKDCPICRGVGWVSYGATDIDDPNFGKAKPCQCKDAERAAWLDRESNLGPSQRQWTLDNFPGDPRAKVAAGEALRTKKGMWLFVSPAGRGKSGLLIAMVNQLNASQVPSFYRNAPLMLDELRSGYSDGSFMDRFEGLLTVPVLAIDEFDKVYDKMGGNYNAEGGSMSWAAEKLFTLLDERYSHWDERMTLIATNRPIDKGDTSPIASRLNDSLRSRIIRVEGEDLRPKAARNESYLLEEEDGAEDSGVDQELEPETETRVLLEATEE